MARAFLLTLALVPLLSFEILGAVIKEQPGHRITLPRGQSLILSLNYSLSSDEKNNLLYIELKLNKTIVAGYSELQGISIFNTTSGHFKARSDLRFLTSPQSYVGLIIEDTQFSDSGEYAWSVTPLASATVEGNPINVVIGSEPKGATLNVTRQAGLSYVLECQVTGAIPLPNITIWKGTEVLHERPSTVSTSVTINASSVSEYSCTGVNVLGSLRSRHETLPRISKINNKLDKDTAVAPTENQYNETTVKNASYEMPRITSRLLYLLWLSSRSAEGLHNILVFLRKNGAIWNDKETTDAENLYSEMTMEQEAKQQRNVEGLQYADLDLRPTGKIKPAGRRNNLVIDEDSKTEYAEVRKT
ncbi:uncharacterized protein LOC106152925 [Lingula anatina]|uniref:Uncharacterized protein LOC106152925 n=1 Tax=Lingula anatina TaxID=7574 RepID=A0A1S3H7Z8_LINAN|nr:uncharacterized protein LOC106152925 [Lingula anatina]|eukprot:XP_013382123.1 uncharacterized protein LOC106152925 [Lingula anatina]